MATKQKLVELIALAEQTAAPRVVAGEADVSGFKDATVFIRMGRTVTDAHSAVVEYNIELSPDRTGNRWGVYNEPSGAVVGTTVATQAVSGTCLADQNVILMTSTTAFEVGDIVFIENTTMANSEFGKIKALSADTSITLEDNLENVQTGSTVFDQAEIKVPVIIDVSSSARLRVVVDGSGTTKDFAVEASVLLSK